MTSEIKTKKIAVIIKHPYRDFDFRVDIMEITEETSFLEIKTKIEAEMLGPFKVIAITDRINFDRKLSLSTLNTQTNEPTT